MRMKDCLVFFLLFYFSLAGHHKPHGAEAGIGGEGGLRPNGRQRKNKPEGEPLLGGKKKSIKNEKELRGKKKNSKPDGTKLDEKKKKSKQEAPNIAKFTKFLHGSRGENGRRRHRHLRGQMKSKQKGERLLGGQKTSKEGEPLIANYTDK